MDPRLPDGYRAETGNSNASGNHIHIHGMSTSQGLALAALAGFALGVALWSGARADAAEKQALIAKLRTEGFTRALIAKGIDPYPHLKGEDP